jgi:hypothetical protein
MSRLDRGYGALGLLIGTLTGLSSSPIANALLAGLLAFAGGGLGFLVEKLNDRQKAAISGGVLSAFSISCLVGLLAGIAIKANDVLTFRAHGVPAAKALSQANHDESSAVTEPNAYLRVENASALKALDQQCRTGSAMMGTLCCDSFRKAWEQ